MTRTVAIAVAAIAALSGLARATTVDFVVHSNNAASVPGIDTSATLTADASSFTITLHNNSTSGIMTAFYMEVGDSLSSLSGPSINEGAGVSFRPGSSPGNPRGGIQNTDGGDWEGNFFSMSRKRQGGVSNGQNVGESLSVTFTHDGSFSLAALIAAMAADEIRFAQHFQSYGDDGISAWLSTDGSTLAVVPLPPAAFAGLGVLGLLAGFHAVKRRNRAE